ncbi:FadR/GntR family transcriptional regulator [Pseudonocardia nigra]|uniref:FadR/GntR family transcriptional regulator n=1 Tax=Pseudonocardia nigra TaxID=1921578 RepID=UPI001C5FFDAF|nr:FadR/GntR family transcriptional regulator [Pseudonocardia nigra]
MPRAESVETPRAIGKKVLRPRQQVEDQIKAAILSGALHPGDRLPGEVELARQFAVSRTTVREALRSLSTQNLITKTPGAGGGSFVRSVDQSALRSALVDSVHNLLALGTIEFEEVAIVRQHLEVPAVRLAAVNRTTEDMAELREIVALQRSISVDDPRVPALDEQFHGAIARASGNRVLASFVSALHTETEPVHYLDLSPEVGRTTVRQHQRIVRAITEEDPAAGEEAMIEHLTYLREHLLAYQQR